MTYRDWLPPRADHVYVSTPDTRVRGSRWRRALLLVLLVFALALAFRWIFDEAKAHDSLAMVYPPRCCYGTAVTGDCAPVEGLGQVTRHSDGWFIKSSGETIPFENTEPSTDLRFHRCVKPDNTTRCFFAPESGT